MGVERRDGQMNKRADLLFFYAGIRRQLRRFCIGSRRVRHLSQRMVRGANVLRELNLQFCSDGRWKRGNKFGRLPKHLNRVAIRKSPHGVVRGQYQKTSRPLVVAPLLEME